MPRLLFLFLLCSAGCYSETVCHNLDEMNCVQRGGGGDAVVAAAAATAAWSVTGCTVNGCGPGYLRCNTTTGMCERIRCGEGLPPCPDLYACDLARGTCN